MTILIGSDPEVFAKRDGRLVSAHGMVPGTKERPHPVKDGAVQVDGMALEFNIDPAATEDEFVNNLGSVMSQLRAMVPGIELAAEPVAEFGRRYINQQPDEAKIMGCDPDFNAWAGRENRPPNADAPFRTGAGHIHVGLWAPGEGPDDIDEVAKVYVKQLDYFLGLPSLLFDKVDKRRDLYGKAGCYRPKPYGFEYRTLSNAWLATEELQRWAYGNTMLAIERMAQGQELADEAASAQRIINNSNRQRAWDTIQRFNIPMPEGYQHVG